MSGVTEFSSGLAIYGAHVFRRLLVRRSFYGQLLPSVYGQWLPSVGRIRKWSSSTVKSPMGHVWTAPRCERKIGHFSEAFGCSHVFGLLFARKINSRRCDRYGRWP